jgi:precorrin-6y C5,15-methyltransferase (decarboxylating) CbiE subunit
MPEALESIQKARSIGTVGVLVSGDPGIFSLARLVRKKFGSSSCKTVPGISSLQVAFARIGLDWADARVISSHAHDPDSNVVSSLHSESKIAIFLGRSDSLDWVRSFLASHQREVRCFLFENLTLEDESITEIEACSMAKMSVSSRSLMLVVDRGLLE